MCVLLCGLTSPARAISDDANPWLAIEGALCMARKAADYSAVAGGAIDVTGAEWRGGTLSRPAVCFLSGAIDADPFTLGLPTPPDGRVFASDCSGALATLIAALSEEGELPECELW